MPFKDVYRLVMNSEEATRSLESARWHLARYDGLQATMASRAAAVLSANALVLAGVAVLVASSPGASNDQDKSMLLTLPALASLAFVGISVVESARGLLALRPWRARFGESVPMKPFYLHNETLALLPTYAQFLDTFSHLSPEEELEGAIAALWVRTRNMKTRTDSVRRSMFSLFGAMSCVAFSAIAWALG